ncbi:hypothetical protein [Comamonas odontotermitis]|uniref:hypothetical protein n=1 Tax=Comamonas odontotermitis TaxID=379895 RepID=UPI00375263BD
MSTLMERLVAGLIAGATLVGVGMACVAYGHSNGKDTNDGLVNYLREKNQEFEKTEVQLRSEVSSLKLELQGAKSAAAAYPMAAPGSASSDLATKPSPSINVQRVTLKTGETAQLFGGKIAISLVGIKFEGDPLRHKVIGVIGSLGKQNKPMDSVDVGFAVVFEGHEVRLISSDTFTATFLVTHMDEKI